MKPYKVVWHWGLTHDTSEYGPFNTQEAAHDWADRRMADYICCSYEVWPIYQMPEPDSLLRSPLGDYLTGSK